MRARSDIERYSDAVERHEAAAKAHDELATQLEADGDLERADLELRSAELERMAAQLERDRAALERENEILRALEMLRGTTYDFRIEATIDVASLYGADILVAALERLDEKIEPGQREDRRNSIA